ncbi:MAG: CPBP family glutamic-type intramembrane protease, partial [Candidatus Micrarchaeia archaeon]
MRFRNIFLSLFAELIFVILVLWAVYDVCHIGCNFGDPWNHLKNIILAFFVIAIDSIFYNKFGSYNHIPRRTAPYLYWTGLILLCGITFIAIAHILNQTFPFVPLSASIMLSWSVNAFFEETLFRGFLLTHAIRIIKPCLLWGEKKFAGFYAYELFGIMLSAFIFVLAHKDKSIVFFVAGILLG